MRTRIVLALSTLALALGPSCIYTGIRAPLDTDLDQTRLGTKEGRSSLHSILWLVSWGDAGTRAAAEQGGITTIRHADLEILNVLLGLYVRQTTVLYGD